jgi:Luciferase-like monooxygenase
VAKANLRRSGTEWSVHFQIWLALRGRRRLQLQFPRAAQGAQIAERGKFDLFFISDSVAMDPGDHPSLISRFEPTTLISALSRVTRRVALAPTVSTSFSEPYNVGRTFATLQHISGGRAAGTPSRRAQSRSGPPLACLVPGSRRRATGKGGR